MSFDRSFRRGVHAASTVRSMLPRPGLVQLVFVEPKTEAVAGGTRTSIGFPALIVTDLVKGDESFAEAVVAALNIAQRDERLWWLLEIIVRAGGELGASDMPHDRLNAFCEDRATAEDTFNLARIRGLTRVTHDDRFDTSTVFVTDEGRAYHAAHAS